eukprot:TRINITY_DN9585_c0_g3_i1.p1 TRINITY_DN9585_c0_g3~~TRINITY_DN9585_c0_g3_i1.p1  ORF type:complete len:221 (+),score=59.51 TRINITY_DN9585_c0_g3_i1:38-664(+)
MSDFQEDELMSVAIVRNGTKVVCGSEQGVLSLFTWGDFGDHKDRIKGHPMSVDAMVKFSEEGVITGSSDGKLRAVSIHSKSLGSSILGTFGEHGEYPIERIALSNDGQTLATASHGQPAIQLWSTEAARRLLAGEKASTVLGFGEVGGSAAEEAAEDEPDSDDSEPAPKKKKRRLTPKEKKKAKKLLATGGGPVNEKKQKASAFFSGL